MGIRQKLMLGFGGLLAVIAVVGGLTLVQINHLGRAIDVILKQNYRSVVACQNMKESLERMNSGILYTLSGHAAEGERLIAHYKTRFHASLEVEQGNITLAGERGKSRQIRTLFGQYLPAIPLATQMARPLRMRQSAYFTTLHPLSQKIEQLAQDILVMNQANMTRANDAARHRAANAYRRMVIAILVSALIALLFSYLVQRWVLRPINRLIESTNDIKRGNLDLVLEARSRDEIGRLSESFNEMASTLRLVRKTDRINLLRTRRAAEEIFKALPTAIAIIDRDGRVDVATPTAQRYFGLKPGIVAGDLGYDWLPALIHKTLSTDRTIAGEDTDYSYIQRFMDNREYFFEPVAVPIPIDEQDREPSGLALILNDVTQLREQQDLKRGVIATVSHQLKTPLTSLRMSVHLLLDERLGPLNEKQIELLVAAREDSERLVGILDELLDFSRIEAGKARVSLKPVQPTTLVRDAVEPFFMAARDKGVTLEHTVPDDLPDVAADGEKIQHVFANLLSNALRVTGPGGSVTVRAVRAQNAVVFEVEDTGEGIAREHLERLFEQFYRVPGQDGKSGVGLGLAIVKEIVLAHGGEVDAESELGRGSVFRFSLPLNETAQAQHTAPIIKE